MTASIRPAEPGDVPAIERLVEKAYAVYVPRIGMRPLPMEDDYAARVALRQAWVLDGDGVEAVLVLVPENGHLLIDNVAVRPGLQGGGRGRRLLRFAERRARRLGYAEVRLYTNVLMHENRRLYARLGYEEMGGENIRGRDAVYMRKPLADGD